MDQQAMSARQFGNRAANYLTSTVHATGADLDRLRAVARQMLPARVLDLGCGAGHASFALAHGGARRVTAYDPSSEMLQLVAREAATRGYEELIDTHAGTAEVLPFETDTFDLVITRYSAHHWASVPRALAECARVILPGGQLVVIDVIAPEIPLLDTSLLESVFAELPSEAREYFKFDAENSFVTDSAWIEARIPPLPIKQSLTTG